MGDDIFLEVFTMKKVKMVFITLFALGIVFPAFIAAGGQRSSSPAPAAGDFNDAPLASIVPVDGLPTVVRPIDQSLYKYDDMSRRYTLEFLTHNYGVSKTNPDPIAAYMNRKYNVSVTLTEINSNDYGQVISTRFAANDFPDFINLPAGQRDIAEMLYDQNQIIDTTLAMRYMPNYARYFTRQYADFARHKNAFPMAPRYPVQADWAPFLRKDWLAKLNMPMPRTIDDLLNYARAVTRNDPDGNGRNDTWFAGGAGNGRGFGMLERLRWQFGENQYYARDGRIANMVIDGTMRNYLAFLKTLNDEGLLAPDWYTVGWEPFKSYSLNGRVGYVEYPGENLFGEMIAAVGAQNDFSNTSWDIWTLMPPLSTTGKAAPVSGPSYGFVFPTSLTKDAGKFKRVVHMLDQSLYAGESYWELIQGGGNEVYGREVIRYKTDDSGKALWTVLKDKHPSWNGEFSNTGLANTAWQTLGIAGPQFTLRDTGLGNDRYDSVLSSSERDLATFPKFTTNYAVKIDPDVASDLTEFERVEFPKFVFGTRNLNDWDSFVREWLNAGGRKALTQAAQQMGLRNFE